MHFFQLHIPIVKFEKKRKRKYQKENKILSTIARHLCGPTSQFLKRNARILRTGSDQNDHTHGSEPFSSSAPDGQSAGIW